MYVLTYRVDGLDSGEQAGLVDRQRGGRASMDQRLDDLQLHLLRLQVAVAHPLHHLENAILLPGVTFEKKMNQSEEAASVAPHSAGTPGENYTETKNGRAP